jgi:hypothetical protein
MQITRRQLYTLFKEIADKHLQIHSFFWGDVADAFGRQDIIFPIMIVTPQPIAMRQGEVSHTYSITLLDRLLDGDENKVDVDSDVYQYWRDVMAQLDRLNQVDFGIEYPMNPQPVQDVSPHRCYGFQGDVSVNVDENYDKCAVPSLPIDFNPELVCLPASYRVEYENGVLIEEGTIASGSSKTIKVPDAPICLAANWELRDTDGMLLDSGTIPSGGSATITAPNGSVSVRDSGGVELYNVSVTSGGSEVQVVGDSTVNVRRSDNSLIEAKSVKAQGSENVTVADSLVNVRKSDGVLITAVSVKADDSENYNVADSVVSNDATTPTYTANIKATENLVLPAQTIEVNGVNEGSIPSVGTIEVEVSDGVNPVTPNSVGIVGRKIEIEVPSGGGSYDLDLVDRFGNAFPTKQVTANATWDLRTLTPFDFADIFLSELTSPSSTIQTAIIDLVDDLNAAGLWDKFHSIHPMVNGTANDHALNLKYPFRNRYSGEAFFQGSPTHNSNGITTNGSNNGMIIPLPPYLYADSSNVFAMSCYSRTDAGLGNVLNFDMGSTNSTSYTEYNRIVIKDSSNRQLGSVGRATNIYFNNGGYTSPSTGLFTTVIDTGTTGGLARNGVLLTGGTQSSFNTADTVRNAAIGLGGFFNSSVNAMGGFVARNYAYAATMKMFNMTQEADHYAAVQKMQTTLGRNI